MTHPNLQAIVSSLGKTRHLLVSGLIGSWLGQVPICLLFTRLWRNDMTGQYQSRLSQTVTMLYRSVLWDGCRVCSACSVSSTLPHQYYRLGTVCQGSKEQEQSQTVYICVGTQKYITRMCSLARIDVCIVLTNLSEAPAPDSLAKLVSLDFC